MGEVTKIEWADHTFSPWIGCTKVSAACDHCYAESLAKRYGWAKWGAGEARKLTSHANWRKPIKWNKDAAAAGIRRRVFCASLADVFDAEVADGWRIDLMQLIAHTPDLDWLLLTKRPQLAKKYLAKSGMLENIWLGTTVEDQKMADLRIPILLSIPAKVRFLSCEPLLERLALKDAWLQQLDWMICGGESGLGARPMHPTWARSLRDDCLRSGTYFFFKQWGEYGPYRPEEPHHDVFRLGLDGHVYGYSPQGGVPMVRYGKKAAGAKLDGVEHREFPI